MWPLTITLPNRTTITLLPQHVGLAALLLLAVLLFAAYVGVLHRSLEQSARWQAAQQQAAEEPRRVSTKAVVDLRQVRRTQYASREPERTR